MPRRRKASSCSQLTRRAAAWAGRRFPQSQAAGEDKDPESAEARAPAPQARPEDQKLETESAASKEADSNTRTAAPEHPVFEELEAAEQARWYLGQGVNGPKRVSRAELSCSRATGERTRNCGEFSS